MKKCRNILSIFIILLSITVLAGCGAKKESVSEEDLQMLREMKEELEAQKEQSNKDVSEKDEINNDKTEDETISDTLNEEESQGTNDLSEHPLISLESIEYIERENLNTFYNGAACVVVEGRRYLIDKAGVAKCDVNKITGGTFKNTLIVPVNYTGLWVAYDLSRKFVVFDSDGNEKYRNEDENCKFLGVSDDDKLFYAKLESGFDEIKVTIIKMDTTFNESEVAIYVDGAGSIVNSLNFIGKKSKLAFNYHKLDDGVYYGDEIGFINENTGTAFSSFVNRDLYYMGIDGKNNHVFLEISEDLPYLSVPVSSDMKHPKCGDEVDLLLDNEANYFIDGTPYGRRVDDGFVGYYCYENKVVSMDGKTITLPVELSTSSSFTQYKNDRIGIGCYGKDGNAYLLVVNGQGDKVCEPIQTEKILHDIANINGFILGIGNELFGVTLDGKVIGIEDGFPIDDNYRCNFLRIAEGFIWHDASKSFVSYDGKTVISKISVVE